MCNNAQAPTKEYSPVVITLDMGVFAPILATRLIVEDETDGSDFFSRNMVTDKCNVRSNKHIVSAPHSVQELYTRLYGHIVTYDGIILLKT